MRSKGLKKYLLTLVGLVGIGWLISSGLIYFRTSDAGGRVPERMFNKRAFTDYQMRLFRAYPDARSCLPKKERGKSQPDWSTFDWSSVHDDDHALVCVYRIAQELQAPEALAAWFEGHGFGVSEVWQSTLRGKSKVLDAGWSLDGQWPLYPGRISINRYVSRLFYYGYGIQVRWSNSNQLRSVQIIYSAL